jgi:thiamine-monophosphate kinase
MKLKEIGEFGFIDRFAGLFGSLVPDNIKGIGDDCAVMPLDEHDDLIITTDMMVENTHFLSDKITPFQLGYKSLAVNLSDIAAMGGTPVASFLSLAIPVNTDVEYLDEFIRGVKVLSEKYNVPLLGGDTTRAPEKITVNVCVLGKCVKNKAILRSTAKAGDIVCVTGISETLQPGLKPPLKVSRDRKIQNILSQGIICLFQDWRGKLLASAPGVNSMMDISDGLASDLKQILKASGKSAAVDIEMLPLSPGLIRTCADKGWNTFDLAVSGGEDYELLCTISQENYEDVKTRFRMEFKKELFRIGTVSDGVPMIKWTKRNKTIDVNNKGFDHFL